MLDGAKERHNARISMKSSWFKGKKVKNLPNPKPPSLSLAKQRRLTKRKKGLPKPQPTKKQDDREIEAVIFVPHSKNGGLRKSLQDTDDELTKVLGMGRTKYVERAGVSLRDQLVNKNIWQTLQGGCQGPHCYVCKSTKGKGISCRTEGTCYQITCKLVRLQ